MAGTTLEKARKHGTKVLILCRSWVSLASYYRRASRKGWEPLSITASGLRILFSLSLSSWWVGIALSYILQVGDRPESRSLLFHHEM